MNISTDKFIISIRHTNNSMLAVEIIDSVTGLLTYNIVHVKELDLDALEQELVAKIHARNAQFEKAKAREDWGDAYRIVSGSHNPWRDGPPKHIG